MEEYQPQEIEKKWQQSWEEKGLYRAEDFSKKPKNYVLVEFPYPSGDGLHVGHVRSYAALDAIVRQKRMAGCNVLFPIGWDAFGLPTENYAIKRGIHPSIATEKNVANFKRQLKSLGLSFDWSREINTTDPKYYKWTQWIFLKLFEKGLAYQAEMPINWCPSCKIGLANEEAVGGTCERCGTAVEKKNLKQWMIKITAYADRLINDLEKLDYPERVKTQQINWIGRSEGVQIEFPIPKSLFKISVFTTRADTLFGVTAVVLAPENPLVEKLTTEQNKEEVKKYIEEAKKKSDFERTEMEKDKTGVFTGVYCLNPINNEKVPIWVGDYVVATYGGGAVMMVPAHDFRDWEFAEKYNLPVMQVVKRKNIAPRSYLMGGENISDIELETLGIKILSKTDKGYRKIEIPQKCLKEYTKIIREKMTPGFWNEIVGDEVLFIFKSKKEEIKEIILNKKTSVEIEKLAAEYSSQSYLGEASTWKWLAENDTYKDLIIHDEYGVLINSGEFDGLKSEEAIKKIIKALEKNKLGKETIQYKLRDWVFSRQHYWGEPIPIVHCLKCGLVPVPEKDLPIELPYVEKYQPTGTGESPLAVIQEWVNTQCPKCHGPAKRETDTMPNWAGSNWYFMRYCDPVNDQALADKKKLKYWLPVDWYNGGMEHTTLHLLYSRFIYKFLFDIGVAPQKEPYQKRTSHGIVLAEDGRKMSKSFGNVINPDGVVQKYGADALRLYEMFMGPFDQAIAWSEQGVKGVSRFLEKAWKLVLECAGQEKSGPDVVRALHKLNKKIDEDLAVMKFNTTVAALMEFLNLVQEKKQETGRETIERFLILFAPFAPHLAEELWHRIGHQDSVHSQKWPEYDPKMIKEETISLVIQINGIFRDKVEAENGISEAEAKKLTLGREKVKKWILDKEVVKVIFVSGKLINIVVK